MFANTGSVKRCCTSWKLCRLLRRPAELLRARGSWLTLTVKR